MRLTKRVVDTAPAGRARKTIWDPSLSGFGLRIEPTGRKTFVARYRAGGGRTGILRQKTLGRYGTLTVEEARALARKLLGSAAAGGDPVGDSTAARKAGVTVSEICDWYLAEARTGRILGRRGKPIKPLMLATDQGRIDAHVRPLIGKKRVQTLTLRDIKEMQADIATGKTARAPSGKRPRGGVPTGGGGAGGRTFAMLRAIFEHAVRRGLIASNPAKGARKIANQKRKFRLSLDQIRVLGAAMGDVANETESPTALAAIRLFLLSGFRRGEVLGLRPEWIIPSGGIDFPDTKAGPQVRPLGRAAMEVIKAQVRVVGDSSEWVFPAERGNGHFIGVRKVLARISKSAGLSAVTPHVLRHSFASVAAEIDFSELTIAGLLGHSAGSVTAGYVHLDAALLTAADRVAAARARR